MVAPLGRERARKMGRCYRSNCNRATLLLHLPPLPKVNPNLVKPNPLVREPSNASTKQPRGCR
ncbi:MAG: hypothetical protein K8U57_36400 [Planctomycetes bacterium]|nr:hypothetical protein [Planctomycetota bacterium]